jgi:NAD(P)H dehydrogenase (quinone)
MSHADVAELFGRVLKRDVRAKEEEIGDWRAKAKGLSEYAEENLIKMFGYYDQWGLVGNPNVLRWLLKRDPASLESFIARTLKERDVTH